MPQRVGSGLASLVVSSVDFHPLGRNAEVVPGPARLDSSINANGACKMSGVTSAGGRWGGI